MKNLNLQHKIILLLLLALPWGVFAKEAIGNYVLEFDEKIQADADGNGKNDRMSYYKSGILAWSVFDNNENGEPDLWLRYKNGDTVDLEISDADENGKPDTIAEFDYQGKRELIYDANVEFTGDSFGVTYALAAAAVVAAGAWYYFKMRKKS